MAKYRVLFDYSSEGLRFGDGDFDTVAEAVEQALKWNYSSIFIIVQVIEWEAKEKVVNP